METANYSGTARLLSDPRKFAAGGTPYRPDTFSPDVLREQVEAALAQILPPKEAAPTDLHQAMHYALLAPGKRLRPLLTLVTAGSVGESSEVVQLACVSEMVHTASLILDDLPCMDDAKLRRNQPCTHLRFSESTAILASVNLLNAAYGVVAGASAVDARTRVAITQHLSEVVGSLGLVGGQVEDLQNDWTGQRQHTAPMLEQLYHRKTGCLFEFSIVTGARIRGLDKKRIQALTRLARTFGLLFQIHDDLLDDAACAHLSGKDADKDKNKETFVRLHGRKHLRCVIDDIKQKIREHVYDADFADTPLEELVERQLDKLDQTANQLGIPS